MTDDARTDDTMRERAGASRWKLRLFVEVDRWLVVTGLLGVVFLSLVVVGTVLPGGAALVAGGDPIETAFQAFIGATITGVTLVVTLNQLVLSQELGAVGDQRERMTGATKFRRDVADSVDAAVSPPEPAAFLRALVDSAGERARTLADRIDADPEELPRDRIDALVDSVTGNADAVAARLDDAQFGTFTVLSAALDFNYSWKIYAARRVRAEHAEALSDDQRAALDELIETLELFGPAREHFKTLYFQWELVDLSRVVIGSAVPALLVSVGMVVYFDPAAVAGSALGVPTVVVIVAAAFALALLPFAVLLAYILRIATVAKRTLSIGPFTLRRTDRDRDLDWDRTGE